MWKFRATGFVVLMAFVAGAGCAGGEDQKKPSPPTISAPSGLIVVDEGDGEVILAWNIFTLVAVGSTTTYTVYYGTAPGVDKSSPTKVSGITSNTKTITGLTNGTKYYFRVSTVNSAAGESQLSAEVSATPVAPPPSAPAGVTATAGDSQVSVSWNASTGATSYTIFYDTFSFSSGLFASKVTGITTTSRTITGLTNGTLYYFRVRAVSSTGDSDLSAEVSAKPIPPPSAPTGITATEGAAQVGVSWTASTGATSYTVYYGTTPGVTTSASKLAGLTTTSQTVTGLANGTKYYFRVSAVNSIGESPLSVEVSATPTRWSVGPLFGSDGAYNHTATVLDNGNVLIVGGTKKASTSADEASLDTYFIYDPVAKNITGAQQFAGGKREKHTATLLNNGRVLVVGGAQRPTISFAKMNHDSNMYVGAILYDPILGWQATGPLSTARFGHAAVRNAADQVLIIGGFSWTTINNRSTEEVEFYDSQGTTANGTGNLNTHRWRHTAIGLDTGKILVAGGVKDFGYGGSGSASDVQVLGSCETFTGGSTSSWSVTAALFVPRFGHTATILADGRVLVVGGYGATGVALNSTEIYQPSTGQWSTGPLLATARGDHIAVLLDNGKVLVAGGAKSGSLASGDDIPLPQSTDILSSAEIYDPGSNTWSQANDMYVPRWRAVAVKLSGGSVFVVGGFDGTNSLNTTEIYKP